MPRMAIDFFIKQGFALRKLEVLIGTNNLCNFDFWQIYNYVHSEKISG